MGGKTRTDANGKVAKGWDHDPPAKEKLVPFGIVMRVTGALMLLFGSHETSDAWVECAANVVAAGSVRLRACQAPGDLSGQRPQELRSADPVSETDGPVCRLVGLEIRLVYYPPYHSKYNPIERCWSALEKKWNGVLLNCLKVVLQCALRMTWKSRHPIVKRLHGEYPDGVRVAAKEMKEYEARLERSATLPKYDITIKPRITEQQGN